LPAVRTKKASWPTTLRQASRNGTAAKERTATARRSSPQLATLDGVEQVLVVSDFGLESFDPATGKVLWDHDWTIQGIFRVCQPHVLPGGRIVLGTPMNGGTRLLSVARDGAAWKVAEEWTADDFKPYFNDVVSHDGFLYGFDGDLFTCRDLATGKRRWKKGRYGHGQVLLAADQGCSS
jgi:hypothetical protein